MNDSYLFYAGWLFFAGWAVILVALNCAAFAGDLFPSRARYASTAARPSSAQAGENLAR